MACVGLRRQLAPRGTVSLPTITTDQVEEERAGQQAEKVRTRSARVESQSEVCFLL